MILDKSDKSDKHKLLKNKINTMAKIRTNENYSSDSPDSVSKEILDEQRNHNAHQQDIIFINTKI
jgi:hypothetical protein